MYRRVLVVLDPAEDPLPTLRNIRRVAPDAEHLCVVALSSHHGDVDAIETQNGTRLDRLGAALVESGERLIPAADSGELPSLQASLIAVEAARHRSDLVVIPPLLSCRPRERANVILRLATRYGMAVLSVGAGEQNPSGLLRRCALALDQDAPVQALVPFAQRLNEDVALVALATRSTPERCSEIARAFAAECPDRGCEVVPVTASFGSLAEAMDTAAITASADLLVIASDGVSDFLAFAVGVFSAGAIQQAHCAALLLPRTQLAPASLSEALAGSDSLVLAGEGAPVAVERAGVLGTSPLAPMDTIQVHLEGKPGLLLPHDSGVVTVPPTCLSDVGEDSQLTLQLGGLTGVTTSIRLHRPTRPLLLVDAGIGPDVVPAPEAAVPGARIVFVRLRWEDSLKELRDLIALRGLVEPPLLIDACAWLDDGGAEDVPRVVDAQRLLRLGLRLVIKGAVVAGVVAQDPIRPHASMFFPFEDRALFLRGTSDEEALMRELDLVSASQVAAGQEVSIEIDNGAARSRLLQMIAAAREWIHWQCYIVENDPVAAELEQALSAAARRGVRVRMLVDAVYSRHDAFGSQNPLLVRLERQTGVEVRTFKPVSGLPDLAALKQRNHRKSIVFDGSSAIITGRNLGAPYYQGFGEVALTPLSPYREVPWLDCGALVRGPLVTAIDEAFQKEWERAGGTPMSARKNPAAGAMNARFILHDGLLDTRTFDTQLALIRHARHELMIVNTFPLVIELQRALIAAVRRGVRVRVLFGNVRPHYGKDQVFPGGSFRSVADRLVRSRLDAVVAAGGEAYEYALPTLPNWDPRLQRVFPHVHAKLLVRDHQDVALGSANFDVTAAYWESEAMLLVHDAAFAKSVEATFEAAFATSRKVDAEDPHWKSGANQRAWLSRHWPSLVG